MDLGEALVATELKDVTAANKEFNGSTQEPVFMMDGKTLVKDTDYTVTEPTAAPFNADTYSYTITGKGAYTGNATVSFTITVLDASNLVTTALDIADQDYTGTDVEPVTPDTLTLSNGLHLAKGTDYTVAFSANVNVGVASRTISFTGNYSGTITNTFNIKGEKEAVYTVDVDESKFAYTGSAFDADAVKAAVTVTNKNTGVANNDFTVTLDATNKTNAGDKFKLTVKVGADTLVDAKEYTIAVRDLSTIKEVTDSGDYTYDGTQKKATLGTLTAKEGIVGLLTDANVEVDAAAYGANVNAGKGTYVLKPKAGNKNLTGSVTVTFTIKAQDLATTAVYIQPLDAQTYAVGAEIKPELKIFTKNTLGGIEIDLKQFDIAYKNNKDVGTATITVTGAKDSNYTGAQNITFEIAKAKFADVVVSSKNIPYDGTNKTLDSDAIIAGKYFEVTLNGKVVADANYTFSDIQRDSLGEVEVTITAAGANFEGSKKVKATIGKVALETEGKYTSAKTFTYKAGALTPNASELDVLTYTDKNNKVDDTKKLRFSDYTVLSWSNNVAAGTATAVIQGAGNFEGTATVEFTINKLDLSVVGTSATVKGLKDVESAGGTNTELANSGLTVEVTVAGKKVVLPAGDYKATVASTVGAISKVTIAGVDKTSVTGSVDYTLSTEYATKPNVSALNLANATIEVANIPVGSPEDTLEAKLQSDYVTVKTAAGIVVDTAAYDVADVQNSDSKLPVGTVITFKVKAAGNFTTGEKVVTTKIGTPSIADNCEVTFVNNSDVNLSYTGEAKTPEIKVVNHLGATLEKDKDYTVAYANNTNATTEAKMATVTVTGKGVYAGTEELTFAIGKVALDSVADMKAFVAADTQYTGKALDLTGKATLKLTSNTSKMVLSASDYTAKDVTDVKTPAIKVGEKATVQFTAAETSNYTGTVEGMYAVTARNIKNATVTLDKASYEYTGEVIKPVVTVTMVLEGETVTLKENTDYTVSYANNKEVPAKDALAAAAPTITIRAIGGSNYADSINKTFTIAATQTGLNDYKVGATADLTYNGGEKPAIITKNGKVVDTEDLKNFDVVYKKDGKVIELKEVVNAGTYTATIVGKGNYTGEGATGTFTIKAKVLTKTDVISATAAISLGDVTYDGAATKAPVITGSTTWMNKDNFVVETYEKEFSATVTDYAAGEAGKKATIKVNAETGNLVYAGVIEKTFKLTQGKMSDTNMAKYFTIDPQEYTGSAVEPEIKAVEGTGVSADWVTGTIYSDNVSVSKSTAKANVSVSIPAGQKYAAVDYSFMLTFPINGADIAKAEVTGVKNATYTGKAITQSPVVTYNGDALKLNKDYTVSYTDNTNAGKASVIITGKGNFAKNVTKTFTIAQATQKVSISASVEKALAKRYLGTASYTLKPSGAKTGVTYSTSNSKVVSVSSKGALSYKGVGKATITITTKANANYKAATKKITIAVYPKKPATTSITYYKSLKKTQMTIQAKKVSGITGYQISYTTDKAFKKSVKTVTVKTTAALNKTITKLASNKTYYVKARSFKTTGSYTTYSNYSAAKSVKVK